MVARYAYEPFGSLTTASGLVDGELHRFTGKPSDLETSLSYFNARYYDPAIGRFTSSDPARDGLNWFVYCVSEPLSRSDPSGKNVKLQDYLLDVFHKIIEKAGAWLGFGPGVQSTPQMQGSNTIGLMNLTPNASSSANWQNAITATGENINGTNVPKSFVLNGMYVNGSELWVHGNATKHMGEFIKASDYSLLVENELMSSFESAVAKVLPMVDPGRNFFTLDGWELGIDGTTGVMYHARYMGGN